MQLDAGDIGAITSIFGVVILPAANAVIGALSKMGERIARLENEVAILQNSDLHSSRRLDGLESKADHLRSIIGDLETR